MKKNQHTFRGMDCILIKTNALSLIATISIGPRILSLVPAGGENLFVELPDTTLNCPGVGAYPLLGGHRLWHAPENSRRTYIPDNLPIKVEECENGIILSQPIENDTQIQKTIQLTIPNDDKSVVIVDHTLTNRGLWAVELSPWAITMMKPGGYAVLPQYKSIVDPDGLLPNRKLVLWPYSNLNIKNLILNSDSIVLQSPLEDGAFKIGFPNPRGWIAYYLSPYLFVKRTAFQPEAEYPDDGSSSECYCNPLFLEMETLGPIVHLQPGNQVRHRETWEVHNLPDFEPNETWLESIDSSLKCQESV